MNAWYSKEFIEIFLHPQDFLQIPPAVNAVLGGNVGTSLAIRWRMAVFYTPRSAAKIRSARAAAHVDAADRAAVSTMREVAEAIS